MPKNILYNTEIRKHMLDGVNQLADAIKTTLGPKGRNTVIEQSYDAPLIINDGVSIAKEIDPRDHAERMGSLLMREAASKTNNLAGDGTTTATVLAQAIIQEGIRNITAGANPVELRKGVARAALTAISAIQASAKPVETRDAIAQVASISSADPEIGALIAEAMDRIGSDGVVTVNEAKTMETTMEIVESMQFDRGYLSPEMVTNPEDLSAVLENPYILLTDRKITNPMDLVPILEKVNEQRKPLLIIATAVEGTALGMLVINKVRGIMNVVAVNAPAYGDNRKARLEDLAALTGGTVISEEMGHTLPAATLDMLGTADSVKVTRENTFIFGRHGDPEAIAFRVNSIKQLQKSAKYEYDIQQLEDRLGKMSGGVAVINVGAPTEVEMKEKKLRIEDALHAAKAAVAEGIVAGGGTTYIDILPEVQAYVNSLSGDLKTGASIILKALERPLYQIAENCGIEGGPVVAKVKELPKNVGFNAMTDSYEDLFAAGIVDPAKVTRLALQSAASVASVFLTTEAGVTTIDEEQELAED